MTTLDAQRRWLVGLSAVGAANMTLGALRQFGIIRRLPDLPIRGVDSNAVMVSGPAFVFGFPDTPLAVAGLAANIPLAFAGRRNRTRTARWIPVFIAAKSIVEVSVAGWFLWQMKYRLNKWCAYCVLGATINASLAALTADEARRALPSRGARLVAFGAAAAIAAATVVVLDTLDRHRASNSR